MKTCQQALLMGALLLLGACAMEPATPIKMPTDAEVEQYNASVAPEERIVCRDEVTVSSNIPRRLCRRISDMQSDSVFTRGELRRILR